MRRFLNPQFVQRESVHVKPERWASKQQILY